jgi:uncharacterized membrane-anchored protein
LSNQNDDEPTTLDHQADLSDGDIAMQKKPMAPLAAAPRFERTAIIASVLFQLTILVVMILGKTVPYVGAQRVLLKVVPVDPRDMFRGDYVTLSYEISRTRGANYQPGQSVYVTLVPEPVGRHYRAGQFSTAPPTSGVFIKGTAEGYGRARYGIESYYVQEGTGHDYENAVRSRRLWADVAIDGQGNPSLRGLVIE